MTGELVNLRHARKRKARVVGERQAAQNRLTFGRTISERKASETARRQAEQRLSGHRRDPGPDETLP